MGNKPGEAQKSKTANLEKVTYNYSNGDKYEGTILNGDLHGQGIYYYRNTDVYKGEWKYNKKNGWGTHYYIKQGKRYVGNWEDGLYHGEGTLYYSDNSIFKGRFLLGEKDGIGYFQEEDGKTYQEIWNYGKLVKKALVKQVIEDIQSLNLDAKIETIEMETALETSNSKEGHDLDHEHDDGREIIEFNELPDPADDNQENDHQRNENEDDGRAEIKKNSPASDVQLSSKYSSPDSKNDGQKSLKRSNFARETTKHDSEGSGEEDQTNEKGKTQNQIQRPFSRDLDSENETVKFGVETINIMEHMEVLNSAANWLLNKPIQEWTVEDVAEWLRHLSLGEYAEKFKENHINGKNLLDLNESDLKDEFQITILGHRKTLQRNIQLLNQIHASGKNSSYIKEKIKKFYEGKKKQKIIPQINNFKSFNSLGKFASGKYDSKHEAIEEISDEAEFYSHSPRNQTKNAEHTKRASVKSLGDFKLDSKGSDHEKERSFELDRRAHRDSFTSGGSADSHRNDRKMNQKPKRQVYHSSGDKADEEKQMSDHSEEAEIKANRVSNEKQNSLVDVNLKENPSEQALAISKARSPTRGSNDMKDLILNDSFQLNNEPGVVENNLSSSASNESSSDSDTSSSGDEKEKSQSKNANPSRTNSTNASLTTNLQATFGNAQNITGSQYIGALQKIGNSSSLYVNANVSNTPKVPLRRTESANTSQLRPELGEAKRLEESKRGDEQGQQGQGLQKIKQARRNKKRQQKDKDQEEQIKIELFKILKETGLNENFIINYNELEIKNKIGEGGYGQVYRGVFSGTDVAIKEYGKRKLHRKAAEDFVKEVKVISSLRHPNIVLYMGACIHKGKYLMITEYLEEGSLFDHLHRKHTKLPEDKMLAICEDIALGMTYLHSRKVLHCDLKSSNILIDSNWSVKLCDFGLSRTKIGYKKKKKGGNKTVQRVGTPNWMAPEILRGEDYNEYSDVYSYGMVLWEMVTDEIPYCNMNVNEIVLNLGWEKKQVEIPTRGHLVILQIIKMCLNFDVEKRPKFKEITEKLQESLKELSKKNKNKFFGGLFADKNDK